MLFPYAHRSVLVQFVKRDILQRYKGSVLGVGWAVLTPLAMLAVYTFVFREVFQVRWGQGQGDGFDFSLRMYVGLIIFNYFAETVNRAPRLVVDQPNLVKKVVFPLELLAWVAVLSGLVQLAINALVLIVVALVAGALHWSVVLLPLVWLPLLPFLLGIGWSLAALGVYVRDVGQIIGLVVSLMMFLSPVFFPASALPEKWRGLLYLNPMTLIIEESRRVTLEGGLPDLGALAIYFAVAALFAVLSLKWFRFARRGFADVL